MRTLLFFLNLGALHCTVTSSPPIPSNVIFSSVNLRNILHWFPGNGTTDDTNFTVQYAIYGDSVEGGKRRQVNWRAVKGCTEITRSWCDLSDETSDLEHGYYARVRAVSRRASSKWALTRRFDPKSDTSFGPPLVSVEIEDRSATITLKGPMRYQPKNHTPVVSMATLYPQMMYNLSIHNSGHGQMNHFPVVSSPYKYRLMEYNTEYCFSATAKFHSMPVQCQSSVWQCITTPPDPVIGQLRDVVVGIVVPSACICLLVVVGYLLHHYLTGKGQKSPYTLSPPSFNLPPLTFPPENPNLILITVIHPSDIKSGVSELAWPTQQQHIVDLPYAPQRSETPLEPEEPWDNVSIDYGFVAPNTNVRGEEQERERRHDGGEDGNNLNSEHRKCASRGSYEKKEWRVEDGHFAGVYNPQAMSCLWQKSTHTCSQTHMPIHTKTEMSTHALTQTQAPLLSFQGATERKVDREFPGLIMNKTPQIDLFRIPLNLQTKMEGGIGEEMDRKVRVKTEGKINGVVEEGRNSERVPLLSAYASKNIKDMSHTDQSDFLPNDYGVLRPAKADAREKDDDEEEEGTVFNDWAPENRKLVLPEFMEFTKEGGLDGLKLGEKGRENMVGGKKEVNEMKGNLTLEKVFVRQASEEEAEAQREMERGGERDLDDILTKWNLVISMDQ